MMKTVKQFWWVVVSVMILALPAQAEEEKKRPGGLETKVTTISQTLLQISLQEGVSLKEAAEGMLSKAAELNLKLVGRQQVHKELRARGVKTPHLEIFQFCDPEAARDAVVGNFLYAAYMPCSIALVEDNDGKPWLLMLNLDMLIDNKLLSPELTEVAIRVNQGLLEVITAGATGSF
jgi:uncharacterized protein (DUF302 family)